MNKIKSYMAMAALLLAGFTSCAVEQDGSSQQNTTSGNGTKVTVKINNGAAAKTRATAGATGTLTGAERENKISELYAVLYKDKNNGYAYYKTFKCTQDTDPNKTNEYTFNVEKAAAGGVYYMYLIANPTTELKTVLDADNSGGEISTEADLYAFTVTPVLGPETDISQVKDFTMTSPRTQIDMKGDEETVVNGDGTGIVLTRLAVRIDVDASALNNSATDADKKTTFQITKVKMNTRYTQSDLMRGGASGLAMTGLSTTTDVEFSSFTAVTDFIETDGKYWKGAIYSCENYDTANPTVLTIEGVYKHGESQSLNVSQQVEFRDVVRDGSGAITSQEVIPLQRNHLYKVVLSPKYDLGGLVFDKISYSIQVIDWQSGETLKFAGDENLTKQSTPSFTVSGALSLSGTESDGKTNPTLIYTGIDEHSVYLTVTSQTTGTMLESTTFPSTQYGLVSSMTTNDAEGNLVETYKIDIDDNIALFTEYTFTISNAINTGLKRSFVLKKRPKLPLEYMAMGSVRSLSQTDGYWVIDNEVHAYSSAFFNWTTASTNFGTDDGTGFNTFAAPCSYTDPDTGVKTTGYYHMPTDAEWFAIVPSDGSYVFRTNENTKREFNNEKKTVIGKTVLQGYKSEYYGTHTKNYDDVVYALRFMNDPVYGNSYRCAYRYQYIDDPSTTTPSRKWQRYVVSCIYVGDDPSITSVDDVKATFWNDLTNKEVITRTLPCTSTSPNGQKDTGQGSGNGYSPGYNSSLRSASGGTHGLGFPVGPTLYFSTSYGYLSTTNGCTVRLFSNE